MSSFYLNVLYYLRAVKFLDPILPSATVTLAGKGGDYDNEDKDSNGKRSSSQVPDHN